MTFPVSYLRGGATVLGGFVALNFACIVAVVSLDVIGGVAPQFGLPLVVALLLAFGALLTLGASRRLRRRTTAENPQAQFAEHKAATKRSSAANASASTAIEFTTCPRPATVGYWSAMIIRRRPAAQWRKAGKKEVGYELAAEAT
ncbi:MAG: hypothetical protein JNK38_00830 [Acidobacteria bacterium]|nr:hypothetical protein [Acidobacteriota bacterium]